MKVAVVILNWNGRHFLEQFLPSVIRYSSPHVEIVIADNASTDDSVAFVTREFPQITLIRNSSNSGFAGGYNEALKKVQADYYVLLNSDVEVTEGWIEPVITLMERDKSIAACQPKILSYQHRDEFEFAGAAGGFIDYLGYPFCRGRIFWTMEKDHGQYNDAKKIFWATGACMFVRASAFQSVGGFDESFFAHMEEIDLCWRLQLAGHSIYFCPDSKVYHVGGGTLQKNSAHKTYLNFRNNLMMLYKNLGKKEFNRIYLLRIFLDWIAALRFMLGPGGFAEAKAVFRAHKSFKKWKLQNGKSETAVEKAINNQLPVYQKSVLYDYFIKGIKYFSQLQF